LIKILKNEMKITSVLAAIFISSVVFGSFSEEKILTNDRSSAQLMTDIYLAGPLFTVAERAFNAALAKELRRLGYFVFLPQEGEPREVTAKAIFEMDVKGIDDARLVVAMLDGPDPDSGTSWECGYAYAKGKPIIAVRTDFRGIGESGLSPYNLMLSESAVCRVQLSSLECDLSSVVSAIHRQLESLRVQLRE
jgi:nucleoside 2-deoxyribosyltransferase